MSNNFFNKQTNKRIIDLQEILSRPLTACYVHTLLPWTIILFWDFVFYNYWWIFVSMLKMKLGEPNCSIIHIIYCVNYTILFLGTTLLFSPVVFTIFWKLLMDKLSFLMFLVSFMEKALLYGSYHYK